VFALGWARFPEPVVERTSTQKTVQLHRDGQIDLSGPSQKRQERKGGPEVVQFKSCPRCQGDMNINKDMYGEYEECLQCGFFVDVDKKGPQKFPNYLTTDRKPGRKKKVA
jgi:hypothetical protein